MPRWCVTVGMWGSEGGWGVSQSVSPDGEGSAQIGGDARNHLWLI